MRSITIIRLFLIVAILLLSACGNQPIRPDNSQYQGLEQADDYFKNQDYLNAAQAYGQLYKLHKQDIFALKAADSWLQLRKYQQAEEQLSLIASSETSLYLMTQARLKLAKGQPKLALEYINRVSTEPNPQYQSRYLLLKADVYSRNFLFIKAALSLIELSSVDTTADVNFEIINNLIQTPENQLTEALFSLDINDLEQGWLEAAYVAYSQDSEATEQWKTRWGNHPGQAFFTQTNHYENIAVLLPMTGRYKNITKSIQQGMIASLYRNGASQQQLTFFDTGSNGENFSYAWYGAIESGADFIIGPLLKNSIKQLTEFNSSTVPVMLLNQLEHNTEQDANPFGFYQFALSQEDEVRNVALRLIAEGKKRIMLLAPESESGRKLAIEFEKDLQFYGGQVVSYEFYPAATHDYSREIKQALGLNTSKIRSRQLQSIISHKIESIAQIRPDIDAVFILAKPKQARLIKPQLKFYQAENVPVYATSQILSATIDTALDKDLNGIKFCQSAFVIDPFSLQESLNLDVSRVEGIKKYFAFGYDAIALSSRLEWMQRMQNYKTEGMSGLLSIDFNGKVHRDLAWAQFKRGKPQLLPPIVAPVAVKNTTDTNTTNISTQDMSIN